jgi:transcriptional regulator with XRE-family HTH domain
MARKLGVNRAEVLKLRDKGLTIREIAERLGCAKSTVAYYLYPKDRELMAKRRKTKKYRDWNREYRMRRYHSNPEDRAKRLEYAKERYHSDPEFRAKRLEYAKERYHSDPEYRAKALEYQKEHFRKRYKTDPEFRAKYLRKYDRNRYKTDPEYRAKV